MEDTIPMQNPMITAATLSQFARQIGDAAMHAAALEAARLNSTVDTPQRLSHFMGQIYVESAGFTRMEENLHYKDPARLVSLFRAVKDTSDAAALIAQGPQAIANRVYANRLGNGNEASGDGWRYRGSGYVQLTGRDNYSKFGAKVNMDLVGNPDLVRQPSTAARVAFEYWDATGCSSLADLGDVEGITQKINGPAEAGLQDRREASARAMNIWPAE
jgi:putative chitinase